MSESKSKSSKKFHMPKRGGKDERHAVGDSYDVQIDVRDLSFVVPATKKQKKKGKSDFQILKKCSATFLPGTSTAILGGSGAGKSSLLNTIAGRSAGNITGEVLYNGNTIKEAERLIKNRAAYVMQDDVMLQTQTPREILTFAAKLRARDLSEVDDVIRKMNLEKCENTQVGRAGEKRGISGGERKRVAIAQEMLTNPSVLFLDEPTSGLDSHTALQVVEVMNRLAQEGRTVVASVHQPSSQILYSFDQVLLLSQGEVLYVGPPKKIVRYFANLGFKIPKHSNPADFLLDVAHIDFGNGDTKKQVNSLVKSWKKSDPYKEMKRAKAERQNLDELSFKALHIPGFFDQIKLLSKRAFLDYIREPLKVRASVGRDLFLALLVGLIYLQLGTEQGDIVSRSGACFFWGSIAMMGSVMSQVNTFPADKAVFFRESANNLYNTPAYYWAKFFGDLPFQMLTSFIGSTVFYWMVGLDSDLDKYGMFLLTNQLLIAIGAGWGMFLGTLAKDATVAVSLVPVTTLPFMIFSGFLLNDDSIEWYFEWFNYLSYFRYGLQIIMFNEFETLEFETGSSPGGFSTGLEYLETLSMEDVDVFLNFILLLIFWIGIRVMSYVALFVVAKRHKSNA